MSVLPGLQLGIQVNIAHTDAVQGGNTIADSVEHAFDLVIAALVDGHSWLRLAARISSSAGWVVRSS